MNHTRTILRLKGVRVESGDRPECQDGSGLVGKFATQAPPRFFRQVERVEVRSRANPMGDLYGTESEDVVDEWEDEISESEARNYMVTPFAGIVG
jgi:hypothetical protein